MSAKMKVMLGEILPGQILAQDVVSFRGNVLLPAGTPLHERHIAAIERYGVEWIYVRNPVEDSADPALSDWSSFGTDQPLTDEQIRLVENSLERKLARAVEPVRDRAQPPAADFEGHDPADSAKEAIALRNSAVETCREAFRAFAGGEAYAAQSFRRFTQLFVAKGISNPYIVPTLLDLKHYDDYLIDHSVKTAVYSIMIGWRLGFDRDELSELCECALFHDIGMVRVPAAIWNKTGPLSFAERLQVQKHVIHGADILERISGVPTWAGAVAYQHHERHDGSGYPKERKGRRICEYARIVSLADHFAALTAPRPFRDRIHGYEAMAGVLAETDRRFEPTIVRAFLSSMGLYPVGFRVALSDGAEGLVVAAHPRLSYRPVVLLDSGNGILDLSARSDISIAAAA